MNNESETICKEVVVVKFEVLPRHVPGEAEENVRIVSTPTDIRTGHLVDTGHKSYCLSHSAD